jgi:tetratricopeptide (TPR) repeat protein
MRTPEILLACACAAAVVLAASCSSAPKKTDTVTTMRKQAAQDAASGETYYRQGRYELALQFLTLALNEYTSVDDAEGIITVYNALGRTYVATGSLDTAEAIFLKARESARAVSVSQLFLTSINLGELYLAQGGADKALAIFEEALAMPEASHTKPQAAVLYHDLGTARKNLGDSAKALEYYGKSLEINLSQKLAAEAASDYYMIASVHSLEGRYADATQNANKALALDKQIENSPGIAKDLYALGLISAKSGDMAAAYEYFQRSYLVYTTLSFQAERKKALTQLIAAAESLGRTADADAYRATLAELGGS